ncbi:Transposase family Tnp2 protein [Ceratobasidium sp. AG-Ba]|nr:Transposase family Tnp2 protein [Ceratobasidium sp. AG-Ba]
MIHFSQNLLEALAVEYTRMNIPLSPTFHYMQHLEDSMLQTGSLGNTHVWAMERANGDVSKIQHNGRGKGVLEGTLMRGWWEHASLQKLIQRFRALPNRTPADEAIIDDLLLALRGGPEHAQQRGSLMAYIAQSRTAYARLHGVQEPTRLSNQSTPFCMDQTLWCLVVNFCNQVWPHAGIFGPDQISQKYLPRNAVRNYSYVESDGLRYGSYHHTSGQRACYGYTNGRLPVRIERILAVELPDRPDMRTICVIVRRFCIPEVEPVFPWHTWQAHLGAQHWEYDQLSELVAIPVEDFSGIFALLRVPMSYGEYWVTISLNNLEPEEEDHNDRDEGEWIQ